jgi:outer membrane protein assembly factor BamB
VIVSIGGSSGRSLVAYDAATGAPAWSGGSGRAAYASPRRVTLAGVPQLVVVRHDSVAGHDPETGSELWQTPFSPRSPNVADVVPVSPTDFVVSSGYGHGSERYALSADDDSELIVERVWTSRFLKSKFANFVLHEGSLFGFDDGVLTCVDAATGKRRWKEGRTGHGQLLLVGKALLISAESGEVWLVAADAAAMRELGRFEALKSKTWNTHAFAAPYLLVRNDQEAACFELALETPPAQ